MTSPTVERVTHDRWGESVRLSNGTVELLAPTTLGPRIVRYGFLDGPNEFHQYPADRESVPLFGGHRLWHAPEAHPRTYNPDAEPVTADLRSDGVRLVGPTDEDAGIEKAMTVRLSESGTTVEVRHELTNRGPWPIEFAPWGITVLEGGGTTVLPLEPQAPEDSLLPDRSLQLWPYTSPGDDRLEFGDEHVLLTQETDRDALKIGTSGGEGWAAYVNDGRAFRKDFTHHSGETYPDRGSAVEAYTDDTIMELETLAPLSTVEPGNSVSHTETWTLADGIDSPAEAAAVEPELR